MGMTREGWTGKHGNMDFMAGSCVIDKGVEGKQTDSCRMWSILTPELNHGYFHGKNRKTILEKKKQE